MTSRLLVTLFPAFAAGCSLLVSSPDDFTYGELEDAGDTRDGGTSGDAGTADAGPREDASADSGIGDSGSRDAGFDCSPCVWGCLDGERCAEPVRISAGGNHTCLLADDGTVWCWGRNTTGELGNGTMSSSSVPVRAELSGTAVQLAVGHSHSCARLADGTVSCWGNNANGRLGIGDSSVSSASRPRRVIGVDSAMDVAAGFDSTCAVDASGGVLCWGSNQNGELGADPATAIASPEPRSVIGVSSARRVTVGFGHACALLSGSGEVWCWGRDLEGQLGNGGGEEGTVTTPVRVTTVANATSISAGAAHTCAVDLGSRAWCWGQGGSGELGDGDGMQSDAPVAVTTPADDAWFQVVGRNMASGGRTAGQTWIWGSGAGASGNLSPVLLSGSLSATSDLSLGSGHGCAISADSQPYCWGANTDGQLGDASFEFRDEPVAVSDPDG